MKPPISSGRLSIFALRRGMRWLALGLRALALLNVGYLVLHVLGDALEGTQSAPARVVALGLVLFSGLPWLAAIALRRWQQGGLVVEGEHVVLELGRTRFEIPIASVKELRGGRAPWPEHTVTPVLASGKPFERALAAGNPRALVDALTRILPEARAELPPASLAFAEERSALRAKLRWVLPIKWGAAPLALAIIAFRLQQIIMFGGPFGQYQLVGLGPYLTGFLDMWLSVVGDLVLYATSVRFVLELAAIGVTWAAPRAARPARIGAEALALIAFFVVVPGFVASKLLG